MSDCKTIQSTPNVVRLTKTNLMFGPSPLLRMTVFGIAPRPLDEISSILGAAIGQRVDFSSRYGKLTILADALDRNDWTKACVIFAHLSLPQKLEDDFVRRLEKAELLWKANFNPDEPRDERGRCTTNRDHLNENETSGQIFPALGLDCTQILAVCRVKCTDDYVAGIIRRRGPMRRCIRECMRSYGCFDF